MKINQLYKLNVVMRHRGRMKDLETNFNWMTLEMTETDLKIDDWMMINKVHNNLKKYNKLKQLTTFKLKMLEVRWYL